MALESSRPAQRSEQRGLASAYCSRCDGTTTHADDACTGCLTRAENRQVGALWLALGAPLLLLGATALRSVPLVWPGSRNDRSTAALALMLLLAGCFLAGRGLRAILRGRSPD